MSLAEALAAVGLLGLAAAAALVLLRTSADEAARAAFEGRRAEATVRVVDGLRSGRLPTDSGAVRIRVGTDSFTVSWTRVAGALRVRSDHAGGTTALVLGPAGSVP